MKLYLRTLLIVSFLSHPALALFAQDNVTITEFMASNSRTLIDDFGQYPDWIELFNGGTTTVNLGGWYLSDSASNLKKWQFPATNLNAGAFLVVFASGRDRAIPGLPLHTNFKISSGGGYLGLIRPDGTNIASQFSPYPTQAPDVSYGSGVLTTNQTLIATNSPALVRVPSDNSAGTDWTGIGFDDSGWIQGTNGVGYGTTNVAQADYSAAVLPTAPVGYWRFSESSGTTSVNAGSGSGLDGTYNGATPGTAGPRPPDFNGFEPNNNAPTFNGISGYISVGNSLLNNRSAFTIAGWIKPSATPGSRIGLFGQNDCVEFGFINGTTLECWTPGGGSLDIGYPYAMNTWHHVVAVGDGASIRIFADGVLLGTGGGSTASYGSSSFNFNIGGGGIYDATGNFFGGQIDEVVVYHRALTTNEIFAL
ncbi:MAG TPA: LamG-like jellyroll fold domain-containing protein, partial [Verrucomicrobiae bacterium]|nr:LamG-like jellyroll fold domain-containing protein [Verrucomicrobiae bacterium]